MSEIRWARVRAEASCELRRGAWYRVLRLTPHEVVLDVNSRPLGVSRSLLYMLPAHPGVWSVVPRARHAGALPSSWGARGVVCPRCPDRARLLAARAGMRRATSGGGYETGWGGDG